VYRQGREEGKVACEDEERDVVGEWPPPRASDRKDRNGGRSAVTSVHGAIAFYQELCDRSEPPGDRERGWHPIEVLQKAPVRL